MTQRIPPQALEIEQAVLGAVMLQRDALVRVADLLTPEMFYPKATQAGARRCVGRGILPHTANEPSEQRG